jgi:hypothetical protein
MLGLPSFLLSCGGDSSSTTDGPAETRTLFFNLAHEENWEKKTYFLIGGGNQIQLSRNSDAPQVLEHARATNPFLRAISNDQLSHFAENAVFTENSVTLCRISSPIDKNAGTWSLSMLYLHIPNAGAAYAFAQAPKPLALSAKRDRYRIGAALTEQDLRDENALIDSSNHAAALIMLHPLMLRGEPNQAHHIYTTYASVGIEMKDLAQTLMKLGAALPQTELSQANDSGWATLRLLVDANTDTSIKNLQGPEAEQFRHFPDWHADVDRDAKRALKIHISNVRRNEDLCAIPNHCKIPTRHTWNAEADPNLTLPAAASDQSLRIIVVNQNSGNGLDASADFSFSSSGNNILATINLSNWKFPYLSIFLKFLDDKHPANLIPPSVAANTRMFATTLSSQWAIYDIPTTPGAPPFLLNLPNGTSRAHMLAGGLAGMIAANNYPQTTLPGAASALIINFGLETFFFAAGMSVDFRNKRAISFSA